MSKEYLFVYGTLLDEATRKQVIGRDVTGRPDELPGYCEQEIQLNGEPYACAESAQDSKIQGMTLEISVDELTKVDTYETDAYERKQTQLSSGKTAWFYALP